MKLKQNAVTSTWWLKWPSTGFSEQNHQLGEKKKTCQREGSGVLNHWSLRILKHLPEWEPKLLLEEFNFPEWRMNYSRSLLCGAKIHRTSFKLPPKQQLVVQDRVQEKNEEDCPHHLAALLGKPVGTDEGEMGGGKGRREVSSHFLIFFWSHNLCVVIFLNICIQGQLESQTTTKRN